MKWELQIRKFSQLDLHVGVERTTCTVRNVTEVNYDVSKKEVVQKLQAVNNTEEYYQIIEKEGFV